MGIDETVLSHSYYRPSVGLTFALSLLLLLSPQRARVERGRRVLLGPQRARVELGRRRVLLGPKRARVELGRRRTIKVQGSSCSWMISDDL